MSNNVAVTAGSGTSVATDDASSVHYQVVKLADGTEDSTTRIPGSAHGLYTDVRETSRHTQLAFTPVIDTNAYTSGDCLGGLNTLANAARVSGSGGVIQSVAVLDKTQAQRSAFDIYIFSASITVVGNNSPWLPSDTDMAPPSFQAMIPVVTGDYNTTWAGTPTNSAAYKPDLKTSTFASHLQFKYVCAATSLFVQLVVRGTPTYTSTSDLILVLDVLRD